MDGRLKNKEMKRGFNRRQIKTNGADGIQKTQGGT
jgi:hypothetical protein